MIGTRNCGSDNSFSAELKNQESNCDVGSSGVSLWIQGKRCRDIAACNMQTSLRNRPVAFVWGHPRIASDAKFGSGTELETINQSEISDRVCRLFEHHGTAAFALLDGNFSLILADPGAGLTYLVVDKFGCDDIYVRRGRDYLAFSSHPARLPGVSFEFDAQAVGFFLAHEGFIPSPLTLFRGIETIGRARFLRIKCDKKGIVVDRKGYWEPSRNHEARNVHSSISLLGSLLESALRIRQTSSSGLLLSGGVDSSLLFDIASQSPHRSMIAMTGSVKGFEDGELEIVRGRELASAAGVPHESVVVDPEDDTLPEEWDLLTESWLAGSRVTLSVFHRLARRARSALGEGNAVISGQMADTLADNNYTFGSLGYTLRRAFYSPLFLMLLPLMGRLAPTSNGVVGSLLCEVARRCCGLGSAEMVRSLLSGIKNRSAFYDGRVFGYGEMPGRSRAYFPSLTRDGFEQMADWYSSRFVAPIVSRLRPSTFYHDMLELSLDMVMLHLDTRMVFHSFRLEQMQAELPFLDARVVNYFASLPNSARSIFRESKHVIRAQVRRREPSPLNIRGKGARKGTADGKRADELLLGGSLGAHFRDLLADAQVLNQVQGMFELVDERYAFEQIRGFKEGGAAVNAKFISRLAALEKWGRLVAPKSRSAYEWANAS